MEKTCEICNTKFNKEYYTSTAHCPICTRCWHKDGKQELQKRTSERVSPKEEDGTPRLPRNPSKWESWIRRFVLHKFQVKKDNLNTIQAKKYER